MKDWQVAAEGCPAGPLVASLTLIALRMLLALDSTYSRVLQRQLDGEDVISRRARWLWGPACA